MFASPRMLCSPMNGSRIVCSGRKHCSEYASIHRGIRNSVEFDYWPRHDQPEPSVHGEISLRMKPRLWVSDPATTTATATPESQNAHLFANGAPARFAGRGGRDGKSGCIGLRDCP